MRLEVFLNSIGEEVLDADEGKKSTFFFRQDTTPKKVCNSISLPRDRTYGTLISPQKETSYLRTAIVSRGTRTENFDIFFLALYYPVTFRN